jgi:hypothetical protein
MNSKRSQLLLTGVAAWIGLLLMITTTYGGSIVIGGNYTDIGTIVIVSPKPGDTPQANGTALLNNLAGITADVNNPYVIKLGPGIYDIGVGSCQMKEYVDVEGSGENTTVITGHTDSNGSGVVQGASNAEIRFLTVRNTGGGYYAFAIYNNSASPKITNVTASASGGTENIGVINYYSSPTMTNVTASASGGTNTYGVYNQSSSSTTMTNVTASGSGGTNSIGVHNSSSSVTMMNVTASGSGGTNNVGISSSISGTIRINHSVVKGSTNTIYNGSSATTRVGNTQLDGGPASNSGTLTCAGVYDETYTFYASTCP